jgi:hypothetical protein
MATRHYLYHLSHMTGLGVRTVSDDESPLHRAIVKLTLTTRQSGARVLMVAQSAGLSPPGSPAQACLRMFRVADADQTLDAGCICNLTANPGLGTSQRNAASGAASGVGGVGRRISG